MLEAGAMLIRRCAWHPWYRGFRLVYGVTSWRGHDVRFTDGICSGCSARLRGDLGAPAPAPSRARWRRVRVPVRRPLSVLVPAGLAVLALAGAVRAARHGRPSYRLGARSPKRPPGFRR